MPSSVTATESPSRELARFFTEETGLLQLPIEEVERDIRRHPETYYSDHVALRNRSGRMAVSRKSWVERCSRA